MSERLEGAAEAVVFRVIGGGLDAVATADGGGQVRGVGFVGREVDFAEESGFVGGGRLVVCVGVVREGEEGGGLLLLVVFEFADHCGVLIGCRRGWDQA